MNLNKKSDGLQANETVRLLSREGEFIMLDVQEFENSSGYYRGLLNSGMLDSLDKELSFESLDWQSLQEVEEYFQSLHNEDGGLSLHQASCKDVEKIEAGLNAALYLQIDEMISIYTEHLSNFLDISNWHLVSAIAGKYCLESIEMSLLHCLLENFDEVANSNKLQLLQAKHMQKILESDELCVKSEISLFESLLKWLGHHAEHMWMLQLIRYELMDARALKTCEGRVRRSGENFRDVVMHSLVRANHQLTSLLKEQGSMSSIYTTLNPRKAPNKFLHYPLLNCVNYHSSPCTTIRMRNCCEVFVALGGFSSMEASSNRWQMVKMEKMAEMVAGVGEDGIGKKKRFNDGVVEGGNDVGEANDDCGDANTCISNNSNNSSNNSNKSSNSSNRTAFICNGCSSKGLSSTPPSTTTPATTPTITPSTAPRLPTPLPSSTTPMASFSLTHSPLHHLPTRLCEHQAAVLNGHLYCVGGQGKYSVDGSNTSAAVHKFNPHTASWSSCCSMNVPRSLFYLGVHGNRLYAVAGSICYNTDTPTVEWYDPFHDRWSMLNPLPTHIHEHAGCIHEDALFISGGFQGLKLGHTDLVWRYDIDADSWHEMPRLITPRSFHCMLGWKDRMFVVGGVRCFNSFGNHEAYDVMDAEMYSGGVWHVIFKLLRPASCMSHLLVQHDRNKKNGKEDIKHIINQNNNKGYRQKKNNNNDKDESKIDNKGDNGRNDKINYRSIHHRINGDITNVKNDNSILNCIKNTYDECDTNGIMGKSLNNHYVNSSGTNLNNQNWDIKSINNWNTLNGMSGLENKLLLFGGHSFEEELNHNLIQVIDLSRGRMGHLEDYRDRNCNNTTKTSGASKEEVNLHNNLNSENCRVRSVCGWKRKTCEINEDTLCNDYPVNSIYLETLGVFNFASCVLTLPKTYITKFII